MNLNVSTASDNQRNDIHRITWHRCNTRHALCEPFIWQESQRRLHARLDVFTVQPKNILDAVSRAGSGALNLAQRYPDAKITAHCATPAAANTLKNLYNKTINTSNTTAYITKKISNFIEKLTSHTVTPTPQFINWCWFNDSNLSEDANSLKTQYDLIVCNLDLTWQMNPVEQLQGWAQQLAPGGVLLFSALGPDTARSLREFCSQAGWNTPISPAFVDMHDYGDMMLQAGLSTPVTDAERTTLTYSNAQKLRDDCTGLIRNLHPQRLQGLAGKARFKRLTDLLNAQKSISLELELIFGHAFKPYKSHNSIGLSLTGALSQVSLEALKATLPSQKT